MKTYKFIITLSLSLIMGNILCSAQPESLATRDSLLDTQKELVPKSLQLVYHQYVTGIKSGGLEPETLDNYHTQISYLIAQGAIRAAGEGDLEQLKKHISPQSYYASFENSNVENNFYWAMVLISATYEPQKINIINYLKQHPRFNSIKEKATSLAQEQKPNLVESLSSL